MGIRNQRKLLGAILGVILMYMLFDFLIGYYIHQPMFSDKQPNVYKLNLSIFENNKFKEYYIIENPSKIDSINFNSINNYNILNDKRKTDTIQKSQFYRQYFFLESRYMNRKYKPNYGIYIESDIRELPLDYFTETYIKFERKSKEDSALKIKVMNNINIE